MTFIFKPLHGFLTNMLWGSTKQIVWLSGRLVEFESEGKSQILLRFTKGCDILVKFVSIWSISFWNDFNIGCWQWQRLIKKSDENKRFCHWKRWSKIAGRWYQSLLKCMTAHTYKCNMNVVVFCPCLFVVYTFKGYGVYCHF